eukprot:TRINITY_DN5823_c0_g1_i1.p1 TRINITY_DN5823_c0_g1~~TRINITY_DN5823_c0_g1_i1.p1  ORF type:complete len:175 (-),score=25.62 TRINITY_DN5823_c0_g1_i1:1068-1592(-)
MVYPTAEKAFAAKAASAGASTTSSQQNHYIIVKDTSAADWWRSRYLSWASTASCSVLCPTIWSSATMDVMRHHQALPRLTAAVETLWSRWSTSTLVLMMSLPLIAMRTAELLDKMPCLRVMKTMTALTGSPLTAPTLSKMMQMTTLTASLLTTDPQATPGMGVMLPLLIVIIPS